MEKFSMSRVEAFSDSVFAFAITLLVINLRVPTTITTNKDINDYLIHLWPTLIAFILSFWVIYRFWNGHVRIFKYYKEASPQFLRLNAFFLLLIVAMPFSTDVLSLYPHDSFAVVLYAIVFSLAAFLEAELWQYTKKNVELLHNPIDESEINSFRNNVLTSGIIFACSIPIGFFLPYLTEIIWFIALLIRQRNNKNKQKTIAS